jgi:hypothetical protein
MEAHRAGRARFRHGPHVRGGAGPVGPPAGADVDAVADADAEADAPVVGVADWPLPGPEVGPFGDPGVPAAAVGVADAEPDAGPSPAWLTAVTVKE